MSDSFASMVDSPTNAFRHEVSEIAPEVLRDYFAAHAMQSILRLDLRATTEAAKARGLTGDDWVADCAYSVADAMLRRRVHA